ncbi:MAG: 50S ribosomal protein L11 methyltransferase [Verrucomicrobia bacterium]|nr:50S ribosomal protein L11 methyltransferase [Verrucomicrobiota bacterium]
MKKGDLCHVSITTSPEAEEAVAAFLERVSGEGASIYFDHETGVSTVSVFIPIAGAAVAMAREFIPDGLRAIASCGLDIQPARIRIRPVKESEWRESWKKHFKPIQVGSQLLIRPSWSKRKARANQKVVVLDPGLSFGTGQHPTTAFCLEQLGALRRKGVPQGFLDIGTGSGILAIAAAKLGYGPVHALDSDADAVRVAERNALRNRVADRVRFSRKDLAHLPLAGRHDYDVVCANLVDLLLIEQHRRIIKCLRPGGSLVLAGILVKQFESVQTVYENAGLKLQCAKGNSEWRSGLFQ